MPSMKLNGAEIHYQEHVTSARLRRDVSGPPDSERPRLRRETIVFAHGLLWSGRMFDHQVDALKDRYRCISFDFRGQGGSEITASGYDMDTLTEDAVALIEALDCAPCHFLGLSMGGFVGQRLALRHPALLKSLMLLETSADPEPEENIRRYRLLSFVARWLGFRLVAGPVMQIMFGQKFLNDPARAELRAAWRRRLVSNHRIGTTRAVKGVIDRVGTYDDLHRIDLPTLIIVGDQDIATVPAKSERMHRRIEGSKLVIIPGAGHTSTVEEPAAVNAALEEFLGDLD